MITKQPELYTKTSIERAIELTAWLRDELDTMRLRIREEQGELRRLEFAMRNVQDMLIELQQGELF
jgi:hypothetical protein